MSQSIHKPTVCQTYLAKKKWLFKYLHVLTCGSRTPTVIFPQVWTLWSWLVLSSKASAAISATNTSAGDASVGLRSHTKVQPCSSARSLISPLCLKCLAYSTIHSSAVPCWPSLYGEAHLVDASLCLCHPCPTYTCLSGSTAGCLSTDMRLSSSALRLLGT